MRHFFIEIIYKAELEEVARVRPLHREFLKKGYENGMLLMSGPQVPRIGGFAIARGETMEKVAEFFKDDPYQKEGVAKYEFMEINPVHHQDFMKEWLGDIG